MWAKMSLRHAQNTFMPESINSVVLLVWLLELEGPTVL